MGAEAVGQSWPCRHPAPIFAAIKLDRESEAFVPVRGVGRGERWRGNQVQVFGAHRGAAGPIHRTRQRDGAVDYHRLGVRDPRLSVGTPAANGSIPLSRSQGVVLSAINLT